MATGLLLFVCLLSIGHVNAGIAGTDDECPPDNFRCEGREECFHSSYQCNGNEECGDGSDEEDCLSKECFFPDAFKCESSGICVRPAEKQCDGYNNCPDGSDEEDCLSKECSNADYFKCESNGLCYSPGFICDGNEDCPDGSDEEDCLSKECFYSDYFKCESSGICVYPELHCNGNVDCPDGSDEDCQECPNPDHFMCESSGSASFHVTVTKIVKTVQMRKIAGAKSVPYPAISDVKIVESVFVQTTNVTITSTVQTVQMRKIVGAKSVFSATFSEKLCDGEVNCLVDGSDERFCTQDDCPLPNIFCGPGSCINETRRCDGVADCHDQSDEGGCGKLTFY
ncbi:hypothetical protein Bbelb_257690 [Branchiostoma belcheri]|nr:hypothetical protein Bbelb_257690 [Branchiostoma belcheri]